MSTPAPQMAPKATTGLSVAVAVLAVVVVGLIAALIVVSGSGASDRDDQARRIDTQQRQLAALQRRVETAEQQTTGPQGEFMSRLSKLQRRIKGLEDCLPELQTEVNTLEIDRESLIISPSAQVSRVCSDTLYGPPPRD